VEKGRLKLDRENDTAGKVKKIQQAGVYASTRGETRGVGHQYGGEGKK